MVAKRIKDKKKVSDLFIVIFQTWQTKKKKLVKRKTLVENL